MKNFKRLFFFFLLIGCFSLVVFHPLFAKTIEEELGEIAEALRLLEIAEAPLKEELGQLKVKVADIERRISNVEARIIRLGEDIDKRMADLVFQKELFDKRVRNQYIKQRSSSSPLLLLFSTSEAMNLTQEISANRIATQRDQEEIIKLAETLLQLKKDKDHLEKEKISLASVKETFNNRAGFLAGEIKNAEEYRAQLTARQKDLLAAKVGTFSTSVGEVPAADDPASRPDYNPGFSPAFAAFSFGAPHFKGMSQYGAFGRAKSGQGHEDILRAYYGDVRFETVDTNFNLPTTAGNLPFEDNYLKGIAEMPAKWADEGGHEALKAQAIAARSYALAYTGWRMGDRSAKSAICITEACQVYNSGKANNPGRWGDAVNDTKGKILVSNSSNEVVNSWYSSTSGGYQESYSSLGHNTPAFWYTTGGRSAWTSGAYEKVGGSPWFYKAWYKSRSGTTCGRSHPWLTQEEMADIINAVIVYENDSASPPHIWQVDDACLGSIPDVWSKEKMRQEAGRYGGAVTNVSGVSVVYSEAGITARVTFDTNRGKVELDGQKFYKVFNLRAPGAIHLKSGLFNIDKK